MKKVYVILFLFLFTKIFCFSQYDTLALSNEFKPTFAGLSIRFSGPALFGIAFDIFPVKAVNLEFYFLPKLITVSSVGAGIRIYPLRRSEKTLLTPYLGVFYGGGVKEDITFFGNLLERIEYKILYFPIGVSIPNDTSINFAADIGFAYLSEFKNAQGLITEKENLKFNYSVKVGIRF